MALLTRVTGVSNVIRNLRKASDEVERRTQRGIKRAGLFLQRESQLVVPVDLGNLKNSAFTRAFGKGFSTEVWVGYTADYAIYVHENLQSRHKPGKIAKYLERPLRENRNRIFAMIGGEIGK